MNHLVSIGERLREVRAKTGLSQEKFAQCGGVTKKTQMLYEAGERAPDAKYLSGIALLEHVDVLYVLTGVVAEIQDHISNIQRRVQIAKNMDGTDLEKQEVMDDLYARLRNPAPSSEERNALMAAYVDAVPILRVAALAVLKSDPNSGLARKTEELKKRVRKKLNLNPLG